MNYAKLVTYCKTLPHAQCERKWGNALTFMVSRKMFALFILDNKDKPTDLWCKVDDELFLSYTGQPGIRPAPYLARAKWIAMAPEAMPDAIARNTLRRARDLIFSKLPKRVQRELLA
ncbi:MAG TPA: MmcQ/YjbR family DNA-binding protein [Noviherbaspirillum sp.]|uniref:MmcQ/YjbR family DNA-binding protein n=1 Tax=Noviherbaspirillum sp. TaxID=1926288 RepID=UPI002D6BB4BC|nr:MmcQ/YjbR family DNA-binding protein [Noviherbaspirillum sp.]HYD93982.1 MmcQ/YjbR family DNA-binding protein [Noviherbaspirillum sp.]